jgi:hypothetical protein
VKAVDVNVKAALAADGAGSVIGGPSEVAVDGWLDRAAGADAAGGMDPASAVPKLGWPPFEHPTSKTATRSAPADRVAYRIDVRLRRAR